jgi:hypothetical protein
MNRIAELERELQEILTEVDGKADASREPGEERETPNDYMRIEGAATRALEALRLVSREISDERKLFDKKHQRLADAWRAECDQLRIYAELLKAEVRKEMAGVIDELTTAADKAPSIGDDETYAIGREDGARALHKAVEKALGKPLEQYEISNQSPQPTAEERAEMNALTQYHKPKEGLPTPRFVGCMDTCLAGGCTDYCTRTLEIAQGNLRLKTQETHRLDNEPLAGAARHAIANLGTAAVVLKNMGAKDTAASLWESQHRLRTALETHHAYQQEEAKP